MTLIATFVPFEDLDDFVSAGILVAFTVTNSSLIVMRRQSPTYRPRLLGQLLIVFNIVSLGMTITFVHAWRHRWGKIVSLLLTTATAISWALIKFLCPPTAVFGGNRPIASTWEEGVQYFRTPFVPLIPCLGTIFNWYLVAQLEMFGILLLLIYFFIAALYYFYYRAKKASAPHRRRRFRRGRGSYEEVEMAQGGGLDLSTTRREEDATNSGDKDHEVVLPTMT